MAKLYDARVGGGFPYVPPTPPCDVNAGACEGEATAAPELSGAGTASFEGPGNPAPGAKTHRCRRLGLAARRLAHRVKRLRGAARRTHNAKLARRLRHKARRYVRATRRHRKAAKRCRRAARATNTNGRAGR